MSIHIYYIMNIYFRVTTGKWLTGELHSVGIEQHSDFSQKTKKHPF